MTYKADDVVRTEDGKRHRVLWPTKRDGSELQVKSVDDRHKKAYKLATHKIVANEGRHGATHHSLDVCVDGVMVSLPGLLKTNEGKVK